MERSNIDMQSDIRKFYQNGFSLFELVVSLGLLLIITSFVISALTSALRTQRREVKVATRDANVKRAIELMTIELGQAGVTPNILDPTTINATNPTSTSTNLQNKVDPGGSQARLQNGAGATSAVRGMYPGRPLIM